MSEKIVGTEQPGLMGSDPIQSKESSIFQRIRRKLRLLETIEWAVFSLAIALLGSNNPGAANIITIFMAFFVVFLTCWGVYLMHIRVARFSGKGVDILLWVVLGVLTAGFGVVGLILFDINRFIMVKVFYRGDAPVEYACSPASKAAYKAWRYPDLAMTGGRPGVFGSTARYTPQMATTVKLESLHASVIERLLYNSSALVRIGAAEQLRKITESDVYVVAALLLAKDTDTNAKVKEFAGQALDNPIQQTILDQNPDRVAQLKAQMTEEQKRRAQVVQRAAVDEAAKGEQQMKAGAFLFFGGLIVTILTYGMASSSRSGGTYLICWGPVIFGLISMIQGYSKSRS